jgi:subtilisin-like proprotein convertase family protein
MHRGSLTGDEMKRDACGSRRRKSIIRSGATLALAFALFGIAYYRGAAAQVAAPGDLSILVEILPGQSAKVIDIAARPLVPVVIYGSRDVDAASLRPGSVAVATAPATKQPDGQLRAELKDINHDGRDDLLITVAAVSLKVTDGDQLIPVTATTADGRRVAGITQARIVNAGQSDAGVPDPKTPTASNTSPVSINDSDFPPTMASPYPSSIAISGLNGSITKVTVDLKNLTHTFSDDLDILLVGPTGATAIIWSDAGGSWPIFNLNVTLDDAAPTVLPDNTQITPGTYKPADYLPGVDTWPMVAPSPGGNVLLSVFNGTNPNGTWKLYIVDDEAGDSGTLASGWSLTITTDAPTLARMSSQAATVNEKGRVSVEWNASLEVDNLGFNVYREQGGVRVRVNREMIAGSALQAGPGVELATGRAYRCLDQLPAGKTSARYWIEAVGLDGHSDWHGPVSTVAARVTSEPASPSLNEISNGRHKNGAADLVSVNVAAPRLEPGSATALKLYITRTGVYRVTQAEVLAAGLSASLDPRLLRLDVDGREQPIIVTGEDDGRFDASDAIEFYALAPDSPYTNSRVYWLAIGSQPGRRIKTAKSKGGQPGATSFLATTELRERSLYFAGLRNGDKENFFGAVVARDGATRHLRLSNLVAASSTQIEVTMQGVTSAPHNVRVWVNGEAAGALAFKDQSSATLRVSLAPTVLREGDNVVQLAAEGGDTDVTLVDTIRLSYWRSYRAESDALDCTVEAARAITISGFSDATRVMDITDAETGNVRELAAAVRRDKRGYSVTINALGEGTRHLLAFTAAQLQRPAAIVADAPSSWRQAANAADLLIISRSDLLDAFTPLAALRQAQGLSVAMIDVEDLYDEFSFGQKTPQAIKSFLQYAATNWQRAPRYVLIGGDASYDEKDYLGYGDGDVVPSKTVETELLEAASDDWYADFDGDGVAEMAVGRMPVRTVSEASAMVAKVVAYEQGAPPQGILLVADRNDDFDFEQAVAHLRDAIPSDIQTEAIARGQLGDTAARERLLAAINEGRKVVNYVGHGNLNEWRGGLLTDADAGELKNSERPTFFIAMTCLNGYFNEPALDSLAESLMKAERGGAVAAWASSGMNGPAEQVVVNQALYRALFDGATIGEATLKAKAATTSRDVRRTWILFGDPAMRLR